MAQTGLFILIFTSLCFSRTITEDPCASGYDVVAKPGDCSHYIKCLNGQPLELPCPPGLLFNLDSRVCDFPANVQCQQAESVERPAPVNENYNAPTDQEEKYERMASKAGNIMDEIKARLPAIMNEARMFVTSSVQQEAAAAANLGTSGVNRPFRMVQGFLGSSSLVKQISMSAMFQLQVLRLIKERYSLDREEIVQVTDSLEKILTPQNGMRLSPSLSATTDPTVCPYPVATSADCDANARYRSLDGTCNNLDNPLWGRSFRPLSRFLDPDYADGTDSPRVASDGTDLPGARQVSSSLFEERDNPDPVHTVFLMTWGQFLDHDITRTAVAMLQTSSGTMVDIECGDSGCETSGVENRQCRPIPIPSNDTDFSSRPCLMFVRSQETTANDCRPGARQQVNQLTSYLDASMIYGSTNEDNDKIRDKANPERGALLVTNHPLGFRSILPQFDDQFCRDVDSVVRCFLAGEGRVNEQVALMATHTVYHRYHNVLEDRLHQINPHWSGEKLFEETRRIMGAIWQHQVFNEYLPLVLGPQVMRQYGLTLSSHGYWNGYDKSVNAETANVFATAAFRFAHSSIPSTYRVINRRGQTEVITPLSRALLRPGLMYRRSPSGESPVDGLLRGQYGSPMQNIEHFFTEQITSRLFSENPPSVPGTDLISLNIQRGRDHGLPGYTKWREWCGLSVPRSFREMSDLPTSLVRQLSQLYRRVEDVDLYPAAVSEKHVPGGIVGPTFACIIARQFRNLKVGDRFWYERSDPTTGFSLAQLNEIRKILISRVICDSTDQVDEIQPYVLLQPVSQAFANLGRRSYQEVYNLASLYRGQNNEKTPCSAIPDIDLMAWRDTSYRG